MKNSFPPLLRGIGMLFMLAAAVIAFGIARRNDASRPTAPTPGLPSNTKASGDSVAALALEVRELRAEVEEDDVVEQVLDNTWFELVSFFGSALVAASFFVEAYLKRDQDA
jgi:hypothetical protein